MTGKDNRIPGFPPIFSHRLKAGLCPCASSSHALLRHFSQGSVFPSPSVFPEHPVASASGATGLTRHSYTRCPRIFFVRAVRHICKVVYLSSHSVQTVVEIGRLALAARGGMAAMF